MLVTPATEATRPAHHLSERLMAAANPQMTDGTGPETRSLIRWHYPTAADPDRPDSYQSLLDQ